MPSPRNSFRYELLLRVRRHPSLFLPLMRLSQRLGRNREVRLPDPHTELVVEGYFRCAHHYVLNALLDAHEDRLRLAGHSHAVATISYACARRLPTIVLIRQPVDVVLSNRLKHPDMTAEHTLRGYIDFYRRVLPLYEHWVLGAFDEVTRDLNLVIDRVNARFGTRFGPIGETSRRLDTIARRLGGQDQERRPLQGGAVADLPTPQKEQAKAAARRCLDRPTVHRLLQQATMIYHEMLRCRELDDKPAPTGHNAKNRSATATAPPVQTRLR